MSIDKIFKMLEVSGIDPYDPGSIENFPTVYKQTGYKRWHPGQILQDEEYLLRITKFNHDTEEIEFQEYCKSRGVSCTFISQFFIESITDRNERHALRISRAKMQDCWELWLRKIGALPDEKYTREPLNRLQQLLSTIYRRHEK